MSVLTKNIPGLTGVRGVAALWVMFYHIQGIGMMNGFVTKYFGYEFIHGGWTGVDLFFILSGFMLYNVYDNDFVNLSIIHLKKFYISRFIRIYPLNFTILLLIFLYYKLDFNFYNFRLNQDVNNFTFSSFLSTMSLSSRWGMPTVGTWNEPSWSLSAEILGYIAFPILALAASRVTKSLHALIICALCNLIIIIYQLNYWTIEIISYPYVVIKMFGLFTSGIYLCRSIKLIENLNMNYIKILGIIIPFVIIIILYFELLRFINIIFCLLVFFLYFETGSLSKLFSSRISVFLGKISFPLYLVHIIPLCSFYFHAMSNVRLSQQAYYIGVFLFVAALIGLATALHYAVERPMHQLARKIRWSRGPQARH